VLGVNCGDGLQAVKLLQGSVDLQRLAVGKQHPLVASSLHQLALTLLRLDRLEEAAKVLEECLAMFRKLSAGLQEEEASVATACNNLGIVCNRLGQLRRAVELHNEALDIRLRVRGLQHLETAQSIYNLASVYANTGDCKSLLSLSLSLSLSLTHTHTHVCMCVCVCVCVCVLYTLIHTHMQVTAKVLSLFSAERQPCTRSCWVPHTRTRMMPQTRPQSARKREF
jgi:hypothetical protein